MTSDTSEKNGVPPSPETEESTGGKASAVEATTTEKKSEVAAASDRCDSEAPADPETEAEGGLTSDEEDGEGSSPSSGAEQLPSSEAASSPEKYILAAAELKEEGNSYLKGDLYDLAIGKYKKGLRRAKKAGEDNEEGVTLQRALRLNLTMAYLKNEQLADATKTATEVLKKDPENVKALFRRGQAQSQMGMLEQAKDDFAAVLKIDSTNSEASREFLKVRKKLKEDLEGRRKAYSNMFEKTAGLYEDREKQMEELRQKEEEARKKRRQDWHAEMNERQARGEQEVPFDEWEKAKEKAREGEERKKRKSERQAAPDASPSSSSSSSQSESSTTTATSKTTTKSKSAGARTDGEESDEECRKIIDETKKMGYCYFRKDLTEEERRLKQENKPQRIDGDSPMETANSTSSSSSSTTSSPQPSKPPGNATSPTQSTSAAKSLSSWNSSGTTYEEKDMTSWAVENFRIELEKAKAQCGAEDLLNPDKGEELQKLLQTLSSSLKGLEEGSSNAEREQMLSEMSKFSFCSDIKVTKITNVEGEAHVAVVRGTRRFIFELSGLVAFNCTVKRNDTLSSMPWSGGENGNQKDEPKVYQGELQLHDVSSAAASTPADFLSDSKVSWKSSIPPEHRAVAEDCLKKFKENVIGCIQTFFERYKAC